MGLGNNHGPDNCQRYANTSLYIHVVKQHRGGSGNLAWIAAGKKNLEAARKTGKCAPNKKGLVLRGFFNSTKQRANNKKRMDMEAKTAQQLRHEGYEVFYPTVVCDRIATKNNQVFFIEFKKPGQTLRPGQQIIQSLMPENYIVRSYA